MPESNHKRIASHTSRMNDKIREINVTEKMCCEYSLKHGPDQRLSVLIALRSRFNPQLCVFAVFVKQRPLEEVEHVLQDASHIPRTAAAASEYANQ